MHNQIYKRYQLLAQINQLFAVGGKELTKIGNFVKYYLTVKIIHLNWHVESEYPSSLGLLNRVSECPVCSHVLEGA